MGHGIDTIEDKINYALLELVKITLEQGDILINRNRKSYI